MEKINMAMLKLYISAMQKIEDFKNEESGEVNMIAIILIIIVVVGLVAIFRDELEKLIRDLFGKINTDSVTGSTP